MTLKTEQKISLVFANSTESCVFLKVPLDGLEKDHKDRFAVHCLVIRPRGEREVYSGSASEAVLPSHLPLPDEEDIKIFVCGPEGLYKTVSGSKPNPISQGSLSGL